MKKLETDRGGGCATQARTRVISCYISIMCFSSHHCGLAFINVRILKFDLVAILVLTFKKYDASKITSIR